MRERLGALFVLICVVIALAAMPVALGAPKNGGGGGGGGGNGKPTSTSSSSSSTSSSTTTTTSRAALSAEITDDPDPYHYWEDVDDGTDDGITYTIVIRNTGSGPAQDVQATVYTGGLEVNRYEPAGACVGLVPPSGNGVHCDFGRLDAGESVTIVVQTWSCVSTSTEQRVGIYGGEGGYAGRPDDLEVYEDTVVIGSTNPCFLN